ncbi:MAG: phenylacetate--CoA ligase family protein [Planctomycetota bacterium]
MSLRGRAILGLLGLRKLSPLAMARYARRHTQHYARAYADWDGKTFEALPLLTKATAREISPYDLLARPLARRVRWYGETTGSSGSPTPSFFTRAEFHAATLLAYITPYYGRLREILSSNRTCVNGLAFGFTVAGMSFGDLMANLGGLVANVGSRSTLATPCRIARCIGRLRPAIIAAAPCDFLAWMRILREDFPDDYEPAVSALRALLSTAELCAPSRVKRIEEHFDIEHVDIYACVEGFFSLPCPCGEKHVLPAYYPEVLDEGGKLLGTRGTGRFAFTNLLKRSTPMVRYLLDDWVTVRDSACPFGFKTSVEPHGRFELTVALGGERFGVRYFEDELFRHGLFGDYQVEVLPDRCRITAETYAGDVPDRGAMRTALADRFGLNVELELVPYGALTAYREVRASKPILRLADRRPASDQTVPAHL